MPPKVKVTKEEILKTAVDLVRNQGADAVNARTLASLLNCSTQPIFSNFATMSDLRLAMVEQADLLCREYIQKEIENGNFPPYKASGMAYIRFAKEEKELFKLLYMRNRADETFAHESQLTADMATLVHKNTGLDTETGELFHLEMWATVHGIAVMHATDFLDLDWELISKMLTDSYQGLRKQYGRE